MTYLQLALGADQDAGRSDAAERAAPAVRTDEAGQQLVHEDPTVRIAQPVTGVLVWWRNVV